MPRHSCTKYFRMIRSANVPAYSMRDPRTWAASVTERWRAKHRSGENHARLFGGRTSGAAAALPARGRQRCLSAWKDKGLVAEGGT